MKNVKSIKINKNIYNDISMVKISCTISFL